MKTIKDIRRTNMKALSSQFPSRAKFSEFVNKAPAQINNVIGKNPIREIGHDLARHIEEAFNKPEGWMDTDHDATEVRKINASYTHSPSLGHVDVYESDEPLHSDEIEVPFFTEVELSAGNGFNSVLEIASQQLRFNLSTLAGAGVTPSTAACCKVNGDSMEPVLPDGSTVGLDTSDTHIKDGKMYAINHGGLLRVKFLYRMPFNGLRIRSANPDYQDEEVSGETARDIRVIGRVFWYSVVL
jgi:phage repressor protein C with HTH and peptisase S24 domain